MFEIPIHLNKAAPLGAIQEKTDSMQGKALVLLFRREYMIRSSNPKGLPCGIEIPKQ
ncbi:MAG: hypothetical protein JETT_3481 [Candidatus Jettenia ecosi]|uniref:Uncharacterized protein n=1 Tax=Candidatus Jettenia ecosi TaxID=2494326 RepID=A0A533Q7W5_9BACT|nr:MAG: hypothetical protein JETT_3481 [Candidatus Jettenia ecosi]